MVSTKDRGGSSQGGVGGLGWLLPLALGVLAGCIPPRTSFTGQPTVEGGRAGCERKCAAQGLELAGMLYVGEYSDACLCVVPGQASATPRPGLVAGAGAAAAAAAAGVTVETEEREQEQRRQEEEQRRRRAAKRYPASLPYP